MATKTRKKVNFMIDHVLLAEMKSLIPDGERSDFVNEALEKAFKDYARRKALDDILEWKKKNKYRMTTEEIIKLKNYGRR